MTKIKKLPKSNITLNNLIDLINRNFNWALGVLLYQVFTNVIGFAFLSNFEKQRLDLKLISMTVFVVLLSLALALPCLYLYDFKKYDDQNLKFKSINFALGFVLLIFIPTKVATLLVASPIILKFLWYVFKFS